MFGLTKNGVRIARTFDTRADAERTMKLLVKLTRGAFKYVIIELDK